MHGRGLLTDRYELSMVASALRSGRADAPCVFEVFTRRLPPGRRYGVVAGTARVLDTIQAFRFDEADLEWLASVGAVDEATAAFLAGYRFTGDVEGYPEGELYFPGSPVLTVRGGFAECVVLETVVLSVLNHDSAVAAAAARMVSAAKGRPLIEMGSRRTHEESAIAAARAAYLAGFTSTSNLAAGQRHGVPTAGTAAHAWTLLHEDERAAFAEQVAAHGTDTTLLVDTYDIGRGIERAVEVAGPALGAIRIDSGDLGVLAVQARAALDRLGNTGTRIVLTGDLDEFTIASLAAAPVDAYGVGTAVALGSGAPTAGFVYKLVEAEGRAVAKRSDRKATVGGAKVAYRAHRASGTATDELVVVGDRPDLVQQWCAEHHESGDADLTARRVTVPMMLGGRPVADAAEPLAATRARVADGLRSLPWEGLSLVAGEPALDTVLLRPPA